MALPDLKWYENDGDLLGGGTLINAGNKIDFGSVPSGIVEEPIDIDKQTVQLWNDKGLILGSDIAENVQIFIVTASGASHPAFLGTATNGNVSIVEARSVSSIGVASDAQEDWTPIGPSSFLDIGDIPANCMRGIEVRLNVPVDMEPQSITDFELKATYS